MNHFTPLTASVSSTVSVDSGNGSTSASIDASMSSSSPHNSLFRSGPLSKYNFTLPSAIDAMNNNGSVQGPLDECFSPGAYDVVCGRGKGSYNRPGNKHFRQLVATYIPSYLSAKSKMNKSVILNSIIDKVHTFINPETGRPAQFVKLSKGFWTAISDDQAREKVGHAMREAVAGTRTQPAKEAVREKINAKQLDLLSQQQSLFETLRRTSPVEQQCSV